MSPERRLVPTKTVDVQIGEDVTVRGHPRHGADTFTNHGASRVTLIGELPAFNRVEAKPILEEFFVKSIEYTETGNGLWNCG